MAVFVTVVRDATDAGSIKNKVRGIAIVSVGRVDR